MTQLDNCRYQIHAAPAKQYLPCKCTMHHNSSTLMQLQLKHAAEARVLYVIADMTPTMYASTMATQAKKGFGSDSYLQLQELRMPATTASHAAYSLTCIVKDHPHAQ